MLIICVYEYGRGVKSDWRYRIVTLTRKQDHISPILYNLHSLPVEQRIVFKIILLTFKVLHNVAPSYLCDLVKSYVPSRSLRSSSLNLLTKQYYNTPSPRLAT
jgi:hypothetical protein